MNKIIIAFGSLFLAVATSWCQPIVNTISIFSSDLQTPLRDTDAVMHGSRLRLELGASASPGKTIQRVEFFRFGNFIGEGTLGANGKWQLATEACAPVFSASDEPSTTLLDFNKGNGSFEKWSGGLPQGWHRGSNPYTQRLPVHKISNDSHTGDHSVKITGVPDYNSSDGRYTMRNWLNVWFFNNIGMQVGNPYRISFYAKRLNGNADDKLEIGAGYGNTFKSDLKYTRTDGEWQHYEIVATPKRPPLGVAKQIVFTSRKNRTAWLIDTVEVTRLVDSQDIYQARVLEDDGSYTWSEYSGIKTTPFEAKINFQSKESEKFEGFQQDHGDAYHAGFAFDYGWAQDNQAFIKAHSPESDILLAESVAFSAGTGVKNMWELKVPDGEFMVKIHLPLGASLAEQSSSYSLMIEDELFLNGKYTPDASSSTVTGLITVADGRLTLRPTDSSDENRIAAIEVTQISADNEAHVYRRGNSDRNDTKTTVVALDGQAGYRSVDLSVLSNEESKPMHYSAVSSDHTIPAHEPVSNFGSWKGSAKLLTDVSYDFGVSAGNVYEGFNGVFLADVLDTQTAAQPQALKGFYLTVRNREDGSLVDRFALELPNPDTQEWNALIHEGVRKKFKHTQYGLNTWIRIKPSAVWNYAGTATVEEYNYIFTHMADANSVEYVFILEAASSFYGTPAVQFSEGSHDGTNTTNILYSISFDEGAPWRKQQFELSHSGEILPSSYQGTDTRGLSMSDVDLSDIIYRFRSSSGTGAGDVLDYSSQAMVDQFKNTFASVDDAPEFKNHPILDQLVADYNSDPLALARYVHNEIGVTDYVGVHPGLTATNIPVEVVLGGLHRDALAVLQEEQGNPRELCILLVHLLRLCGVPAAIAEPSGGSAYLLDTDYSRLIGQNIAGTELTPEKIPLDYPWVVAYVEGEDQPFKHLFPWIKEAELTEGHDLYDLLPDRLNNGFKYFEKFIRADDEVMMLGADGRIDPEVRGHDDDQPYVLWPALMKRLCAQAGVSWDDVGIRKLNRPQQYARWAEFPRPLEILGQPVLYANYADQANLYDTIKLYLANDDGNKGTVDLDDRLLFQTRAIPLMDLHNRSVNIDYDYTSNGQIIISIAPFLPYSGPVNYVSTDYPSIGAADYVTKAKLGYKYVVNCPASNAEFAYEEHRQRSFTQTFQQQHTRVASYFGHPNFWNVRKATFDPDLVSWDRRGNTGILTLDHNQIRPGNYAFVYNYGSVTTAMLEKHARDFVSYDQNVVRAGGAKDDTVALHRLFTLMGQLYWKKSRDFESVVAQKHKYVLPGKGGALTTGMAWRGGDTYPFVDVFSLFTNAHPGGRLNLDYGWDIYSEYWDFAHVSHMQGSAYEHAILRNFLGAEGAYSTVKVLQEASLRHRSDPDNIPDIITLTTGPNGRGKDWVREGEQRYQGKQLKNWHSGLWNRVKSHLGSSITTDAFELAFMTPGPVEVDEIPRMGVAAVQYSGSAGMYISSAAYPLNGGGADRVEGFFERLFSRESGLLEGFISQVVAGTASFLDISGNSSEAYTYYDADRDVDVTVSFNTYYDSDANEWVTQKISIYHDGVEDRLDTMEVSFLSQSKFKEFSGSSSEFYGEVLTIYDRLVDGSETDTEEALAFRTAIDLAVSRRGIISSRFTEGGQLQGGDSKTSYNNGKGELVGDPVNLITGDFYIDASDLNLESPFPLSIRRNYSSLNTADNGMGVGWRFAFMHYLEAEEVGTDSEAILYAAEMDGTVIAYRRESAEVDHWTVDSGLNPQLKNSAENGVGSTANLYNNYIEKSGSVYTLYAANGEIRIYKEKAYPWGELIPRTRPYLDTWHDAHGNGFSFSYYDNSLDYGYGNIKRIHSTNGVYLNIQYSSKGQISEVFTSDGRRVQYDYSDYGDLVQVTLPDRSVVKYFYGLETDSSGKDRSTHLLSRVERPLGRILENEYDSSRRVIKQRSSVGSAGSMVEIASYVYTHTQQTGKGISGYTIISASNGGITRYDYIDGQLTTTVDAENNRVEQDWYTSRLTFPNPDAAPDVSRLIAETTVASLGEDSPGGFPRSLKRLRDKRGFVTYFWYDADGNIVQTKKIGEIDGDLNNGDEVATSTAAYNDRYLPTGFVDPLGNITRIEYTDTDYPYLPTATKRKDSSGVLISRTERAYVEVKTASASAYGLNSEVRQAVGTDDESFVHTEYSAHGFPVRVTQYTDEDDLGNASSDPNVVLSYVYDIRGLLIEQSDMSGAKTAYQFDPMSRLTATRNYHNDGSLLSTKFNYYNAAGDLEWRDGPRTGVEDYTYMRYDGAGRLSQQLVWRSQANAGGVGVESLSQHSDEAFSTNQYFYDSFGNLTAHIDPSGHESRMAYDKIGRKLGESHYEGVYVDGAEPLSSLAWTYEPGGEVHTSTNTLGGVTEYLYTDSGALRLQRNPDGTVSQYRYRLDGRIAKEIYPSGNELRYTYNDLARTVTRTLYKDTGEQLSQTVQFFDRRGNIIKEIDAEGYAHQSTYDDLNRVIARTGPKGDGVGTEQQLSTMSYDPSLRSVTITDASEQSVATTNDSLGRPVSVIIRSAQDTIVLETYFDYSSDHHSVTRTEGSGEDAISVTTWTNTQGLPVLVQHHLDTGGYDFQRFAYDLSGNQILTVDALGYQTERNYDGLNRMIANTLPDGATTEYRYIDQGEVVQRVMPGGLSHVARFDSAGRLSAEWISNPARPDADGNISQARRFAYEYFSSGREMGQLQVKRHQDEGFDETYTYDDFLRLETRFLRGNNDLHPVSLSYAYDKRGLLTKVEQSVGDAALSIPSIKVERSFDAYGQIRVEQVSEGSSLLSSIAQTWNSEGLRSGIRSASDGNLLPSSTLFGAAYDYDYTYTAASRLAAVDYGGSSALPPSIGRPYEATYLTNGLVDYVDAYRLRREYEYDSYGRLTDRTVKNQLSGATTLLDEQIGWTKRNKMATYSSTRKARSWNQQKEFDYNPRGQLSGESFFTATNASTDATYSYDVDRLGVFTGRHTTGSLSTHWDAIELDALARLNQMTEPSSIRADSGSYTATGISGYGTGLRGWHNGQPIDLSLEENATDGTFSWSADLSLSPGAQVLELRLANPHGDDRVSDSIVEKRYFSVKSSSGSVIGIEHDRTGRVTRRDYGDGSYESYTWDALGRLHRINKRDISGNGYDWSADYDGLGRRLRVRHSPVVADLSQSAQMNAVSSVYDPESEFLELGLKVDSNATQWKVYGNDLDGRYGGLHGIGGLVAVHGSDPASPVQPIDDVQGHQLGVINAGASAVSWHDRHYGAYGQLGATPRALELGGDVSQSFGWRGYRTDATGLIYMGARYYDAIAGRFISPDPLGHDASMDLYSYANGDPINFVDPTGRMGQDFGLLNNDPNFVRPEVDSFGDFLDIMTTDFPYAVYRGVTGIPSQVSQRGLEIRAEAFDGLEAGGDNLAAAPSTYLAGWAFQIGGGIGDFILNAPESTLNIGGHAIDSLAGDTRAGLINEMISLESSVFFGDVVSEMVSNWRTAGYSILSGDPLPFSVGVSYDGSQTSAFASYEGSSSLLTQSATGFTGAAISASIQGYQLANGIWSPRNLTLPGLSLLNVYSDWIDTNGSLIDRVASVADRIPEPIDFSVTLTVDPTGKHPPKK